MDEPRYYDEKGEPTPACYGFGSNLTGMRSELARLQRERDEARAERDNERSAVKAMRESRELVIHDLNHWHAECGRFGAQIAAMHKDLDAARAQVLDRDDLLDRYRTLHDHESGGVCGCDICRDVPKTGEG